MIWATLTEHTRWTPWSSILRSLSTLDYVSKASCTVRYLFDECQNLSKAVQNYYVAGLYSGIFIMYLQYHASKKEDDSSILFYALCLLYMLCVAMISVDIAASVVIREVSNNKHFYTILNANQLCRTATASTLFKS